MKHNEQRYHLITITDEDDVLLFEVWDMHQGFDTVFQSKFLPEAVDEWYKLNKLGELNESINSTK